MKPEMWHNPRRILFYGLLFAFCLAGMMHASTTISSSRALSPVPSPRGEFAAYQNSNSRLSNLERLLFVDRASKIAPHVLDDTADGKSTSVVILLADQADVSAAYEIKDQDERGWYVYNTLTRHADQSQKQLKAFLESRGKTYQSFWAANMIVATADRSLVESIAARADVAQIDSNKPSRWIEDPEIANFSDPTKQTNTPEAIETGVTNVNAPAVWALGFNGQGIVIGNQDTGMRWTHNAIKPKYRGWDATLMTADHNYNWHDSIHSGGGSCGANSPFPCDDNSHGTHTTGTTSGDDGAGNQIGVAPGAKWIGCRNMDQGNGTPATYTECFQFFIAPTNLAGTSPNPTLRPHVMNNSWGCPPSEGCAAGALETIINNTQASGIFVVASAGNDGSACSSISTGTNAGPPSIYEASFSVGAISGTSNALQSFSSRGPSLFYTPNLLKPNISAPGASVRSSVPTTDTSYSSFSGTSMAGPHVVGVVALLWSARPQLLRNIAATKALLQNTANPNVTVSAQTCGGIPSTQIPNNSFGYGRVDALAAVNSGPTISGRVYYQDSVTGAKNVTMSLTGSGGFTTRTTSTDVNGDYAFPNVPAGNNYTVTPSRAAEVHDPSITAFDASQAARFAANLTTLTTNQQTAADSSNNGAVSPFDASQIARYEASIPSPGSIAGSWKFTAASLTFNSLSADQTNQDLKAILVGDVSGNWTPAGPITSGPSSPEGTATIPVSLPIKQDPPGGPSTIPVTVGPTTGQGIGAYAFDISFNQAVLTPQATPFDTTGT
ncbi:MAG: peptidase and in, kexin, sedolisin, partial [Acidobacteria bacterium]|nr:peptidase and in, kexin, sedolisin [Acidobacteriota bacterium]